MRDGRGSTSSCSSGSTRTHSPRGRLRQAPFRPAAVDGSGVGPVVYVPFGELAPPSTALIVKTENAGAVTTALRTAVHETDSSVPLYDVMTMAEAIGRYRWAGTFSAMMIVVIGAV